MYKEIVIIGGGTSIKEGIEKGLWNKIKNKITIGTNYSIRYFYPTIFSFVDLEVYKLKQMKEVIDEHNLVITKELNRKYVDKKNDIFYFPVSREKYIMKKDKPFIEGVYSDKLVGLFSLTFSIVLGFSKIFLLGMDFGVIKENDDTTHFYENEFRHRGVGFKMDLKTKRKIYNTFLYEKNPNSFYDVYKKDLEINKIQVYNVSLKSKIKTFSKISYDEFFDMIKKTNEYNQEIVREKIKNRIKKEMQNK